jgi:nitrite reductase (NADH) small subunit/3-phenylpropionate/trans-cinnamate dioxygenase ferredoxin subunit
MAEFTSVAKVGDIPEGEGRAFPVNGAIVAIFNIGGEYTAVSDTCPHMGASLSSGYVEGTAVMCPWHAWRFCVKDGTWLDAPQAKIRLNSYEVRLEGDEIQVHVPDPPPRGAGG